MSDALQVSESDRIERTSVSIIGDLHPKNATPLSRQRTQRRIVYGSQSNLPDRVFSSVVALKVAYSHFAMHLPSPVKEAYFARLDEMIDPEDWDPRDSLPSVESFRDFLRFLIFFRYSRPPALALNSDGIFCACWYSATVRLTLEFIGGQRVRWISSFENEAPRRYASGECSFHSLRSDIEGFLGDRGIFQ